MINHLSQHTKVFVSWVQDSLLFIRTWHLFTLLTLLYLRVSGSTSNTTHLPPRIYPPPKTHTDTHNPKLVINFQQWESAYIEHQYLRCLYPLTPVGCPTSWADHPSNINPDLRHHSFRQQHQRIYLFICHCK